MSPLTPAQLDDGARDVTADVVQWRHHLHAHPELSNREEKTAAYVADHLRGLGLDEVITDVAGHGVVGVLRGGGAGPDGSGSKAGARTVLLRADMDALPVREVFDEPFASTVVDEDYPGGPFPVAHACGHDAHTAMLMGAASVLTDVRDELPGTVVFCFQPAEEGPPVDEEGGAQAMADSGVLDRFSPTAAFGMHVAPLPTGMIAYSRGNAYAASCVVKVTVIGRQVHGSMPWQGVDPMPPAADIVAAMGQLYRQVPAGERIAVSVGHVQDVGRFNVIGEHVTLWGTARALRASVTDDLQERIRRTATHVAQAYGCEAEVEFLQAVPALHNAPDWIDAVRPVLEDLVGEENVLEMPGGMGYDDMSVFIGAYGGVCVNLGAQDAVLDGEELRPAEGGPRRRAQPQPGLLRRRRRPRHRRRPPRPPRGGAPQRGRRASGLTRRLRRRRGSGAPYGGGSPRAARCTRAGRRSTRRSGRRRGRARTPPCPARQQRRAAPRARTG
ncbi:M20 metallopeptidase family protein [Mobilicoccus pelagius]|uniref:Peptidase M20 family protein n=1 Tax=Mobilicoccus pelagius NBRC 104925 TaxID=1089455 RepID=H5UPT0_9MICO|nr:peptidase M20 family protein [Mobilicoccus pelagius NBRC 104925]